MVSHMGGLIQGRWSQCLVRPWPVQKFFEQSHANGNVGGASSKHGKIAMEFLFWSW